jgi:nitrate reductase NapAB chaperone NapD
MLLKAFIFPEKLSLGISLNSGEIRYALAYKCKTGDFNLVSSGNGIPAWLPLFTPLFSHTDLSQTPVIINKEHIGQEDPDNWIERQESGSSRKQPGDLDLIREYIVRDTTVYQIETSIAARSNFLQKLPKDLIICTLYPPLWKLAEIYYEKVKKSFLLWKISSEGSIIARTDNGKIGKICNFWPDIDDLRQKPQQVLEELTPLLHSLSSSDKLPVIVFSPENEFTIPGIFRKSEVPFENPPEIEGVSLLYHETYSLACARKDDPNLMSFDKLKTMDSFCSSWKYSVKTVRWLVVLVLTSLIIMLGVDKISDLYMLSKSDKLTSVKEMLDELESASSKLDSVLVQFNEKAGFIAEESRITELLSDLQEVFPEGMWAEEITAIDNADRGYQIDIRAIASSSGMIGSLMEKLNSVKGISQCRMVYSEQVPVKEKVKGIRVKIQAVWKQ